MTPMDLLRFLGNLKPEQMTMDIVIASPYDEPNEPVEGRDFPLIPVMFSLWDDRVTLSTITQAQKEGV